MKSKITATKSQGLQSPVKPQMFYTFGKEADIPCSKKILDNSIAAIKSYKLFCDLRGINFVFMPGPNKETVYYEWVPLKRQPQFLYFIDREMKRNGIHSVNTLDLLNHEKANSLLFQLDDGHWNSTATKLAVQKLLEEMKQWHILKEEDVKI